MKNEPSPRLPYAFQAAGLKRPDISILFDQFLAEVRGLKLKNVAVELLEKLLGDEIRVRSKRKIVQSREIIELLQDFVLFDGGIKKLPRVHQYVGVMLRKVGRDPGEAQYPCQAGPLQ